MISCEEFKLLLKEWSDTCKLLTSGSFFFKISHNPDLFHERWFISISKECYPNDKERKAEFEHIVESRRQTYIEKIKETPYLDYDFSGKQIFSMEDDQVEFMLKCHRLIDPESIKYLTIDSGIVLRPALFSFYALHRQLNKQKSVELSQSKDNEESNSRERLISDFEDCLFQVNMNGKEVFSFRECFNFLCKLINSQLVGREVLLKKAIDYYFILHSQYNNSGFASSWIEEVQSFLNGLKDNRIVNKGNGVLNFRRIQDNRSICSCRLLVFDFKIPKPWSFSRTFPSH